MKKQNEFYSLAELGKILGISRIAVYKKVKNGEIKAIKIGRSYAVPKDVLSTILGEKLDDKGKKVIDKAVKKVIKDYGEVLKQLGNT